jgi:hypothetical protein
MVSYFEWVVSNQLNYHFVRASADSALTLEPNKNLLEMSTKAANKLNMPTPWSVKLTTMGPDGVESPIRDRKC